MCSICGIVNFKDKAGADIEILKKMGSKMKHRGPDDTDIFSADGIAFHHNRLAVMDVEKGHQPMTVMFEGRKYTIVYNGEIYNAPELRTDLKKYGIAFETNCDTEVVLYTYAVYGEECGEKLNGIFAFAVYDHSKNKVFLIRDRLGVKPLFYTLMGDTLLFSSEIKGLLAHPKIQPELDKTGLWQLLFMSPGTINGSGVFKNIFEFKPGECGAFDTDGLKIRKYWSLKAYEFTEAPKEAAEHTRWLLEDAIKRQLVSDVPLCTFLSGGLDSSVITAVASEECRSNGKTLATYSFEYEDNKKNFKQSLFQPQGDDEFAVYLAEYLDTDHTVLTAPTTKVAENLCPAVDFRDFPGQADVDSSLLYYCGEVKKGHTVALSGECSDEIFGGYPWFYRREMLENNFFPWIHKPMARANLFDEKIADQKQGYEYIMEVYKNSVARTPMLDTDTEDMKTARIATVLSTGYFMTSLLERKDRMSMAYGLEVRVPFADHRIIEYVYNVPWSIKFENNTEKALLRNAMSEYLPHMILHRKKSPYPITHNPKYLEYVSEMLGERIQKGVLRHILNLKAYNELMEADSVTWFGQLMNKPQLIAWLIQFDYWFEKYGVRLV